MARSLNGSSDYLRYSGAPVTAAPLTMGCWAKRPGAGDAGGNLMGIYQSGYVNNWHQFSLKWSISAGANAIISANAGGASSAGIATVTRAIGDWPDDTWQHVAAVFESSTSRYAYGGGVAGTQNTTSITPASLNRTNMGFQDNASGSGFALGSFAEAALWNVALTTAEIAALAAGVCPLLVRPTSLVSYWPIIGQYSPEIDMKGGYGLTVTGTSTANHPRIYRASGPLQLGVPYVAPSGYFNRYYYEQFIARGSW